MTTTAWLALVNSAGDVIGVYAANQTPTPPQGTQFIPVAAPVISGGRAGERLRVVAGSLIWQAVHIAEAWAAVRLQRDQLLADSDWRVTRAFERGVALASEWLDYRQALRDITQQADPFNITWPQAPN